MLHWLYIKNTLTAVELKVVDMIEDHDEDPSTYTPVFEIISGPHTGLQKEGASDDRLKVGELVPGYLQPSNLSIITARDKPAQFWMPLWLMIIGAVLVLTGIFRFG